MFFHKYVHFVLNRDQRRAQFISVNTFNSTTEDQVGEKSFGVKDSEQEAEEGTSER